MGLLEVLGEGAVAEAGGWGGAVGAGDGFALGGEVAQDCAAAGDGAVGGDLVLFEVGEEHAAALQGFGDGGVDVGEGCLAAEVGLLFVFEVDDFGAEELGEGGMATGEGVGSVAGLGVVAEGEVGDGGSGKVQTVSTLYSCIFTDSYIHQINFDLSSKCSS